MWERNGRKNLFLVEWGKREKERREREREREKEREGDGGRQKRGC